MLRSSARREIDRMWREQQGQCFFCPALLDPRRAGANFHLGEELGRLWRRYTRDHFQPRALGGRDIAVNRVLACVVCNQLKGSAPPREADRLRFELLRRHGIFVPPARSAAAEARAVDLALREAVARVAMAGGIVTFNERIDP